MAQAEALVAQATAEWEGVRAELNYSIVVAPFTGIVTQKQAEVGAIAGPGQPLVTLESKNRLRFTVEIPESEIGQVQQGQFLDVNLDAIQDPISGRVNQIIPSGDPTSRNFTVKIALNQHPNVLAGMFGRLQISQPHTAITIPTTALVKRMGITGVFTVTNDRPQFIPIAPGKVYGDRVEVLSGLKPGELVIEGPDSNLQENTPVKYSQL